MKTKAEEILETKVKKVTYIIIQQYLKPGIKQVDNSHCCDSSAIVTPEIVVVVDVLTLTRIIKSVRGHRTCSSHSGAE